MFRKLTSSFLLLTLFISQITNSCDINSILFRKRQKQDQEFVLPIGTTCITGGAVQAQQAAEIITVAIPAFTGAMQTAAPIIIPVLPYVAPVLSVAAIAVGIYKIFAPKPKVQVSTTPTAFTASTQSYSKEEMRTYSNIQGGWWSSGSMNNFKNIDDAVEMLKMLDTEADLHERAHHYSHDIAHIDSYEHIQQKRLSVATTLLQEEGKRPGTLSKSTLDKARGIYQKFLQKNEGHLNLECIDKHIIKGCGLAEPIKEKTTTGCKPSEPLWVHTTQICGNANPVQEPKPTGYDIHPGPSKEDLHTGHDIEPVKETLVLEKTREDVKTMAGKKSAEKGGKLEDISKPPLEQYTSPLTAAEGKEIFDECELSNIENKSNSDGPAYIGTLEDGWTLVWREYSRGKKELTENNGAPTLEVNKGKLKNKLKIRLTGKEEL